MTRTWYQRPVLVFFLFSALSLVMAFLARNMELGQSSSSPYHVFSVRFDYFGMDAQSMEELVAIPLEESVLGMPGLMDMESHSQYGQCNSVFYFYPQQEKKSVYLSLRDKVDSLYQQLPQAVQKPRIYSSDGNSGGGGTVMSLVVPSAGKSEGIRSYLENQLKGQLESVEGVSEVVVAGGGLQEIVVQFQQDRMAAGNINPMALGQLIQEANDVAQGGKLQVSGRQIPLVFDTRIKSLDHIRQLPLQTGKGVAQLSHFAQIRRHQREPEEIVRVNGEECLSLLIHASYDGNLMEISRHCRRILSESQLSSHDYRILYDRGQEFSQIIRNILVALAQSLVLILLLVPCFFPQWRITGLLLLFLPATVLWTWGQLQLMGFSLNRHTLSGMTIALGLVADTPFVVAEFWTSRRRQKGRFFPELGGIQWSMVASSFTTIFVLLPLYFLDSIVPGIREVAVTMAMMVTNSLVLASFFFPVFLEVGAGPRRLVLPRQLYLPVKRLFLERWLLWGNFTRQRRRLCLSVLCLIAALPLVLAPVAGKNVTLEERTSYLSGSVEYDTDMSAAAIDEELGDFIQAVGQLPGITFVTSRSTTGVCRLEMGCAPHSNPRQLEDEVQRLSHLIKKGSLHLDLAAVGKGQSQNYHQIQVAVVGDQSELCRQYARRAVESATKMESVRQAVMNFKEPETLVLVRPQRQQLARVGLTLEDLAQSLRWLIFGPVVDKWIQSSGAAGASDGEVDIRVVGQSPNESASDGKCGEGGSLQSKLNLAQLESMTVPIVAAGRVDSAGGAGGLPLSAVAQVDLQPGTGKRYRLNGRPCAYFTLQVAAASTDAARNQVQNLLDSLPLERGYSYHFSREIRQLSHHYRVLALSLVAAVVGIYLILCTLRERPLEALLVSLLIPASLCLPVLVLALMGRSWESGHLVGMVLVAGLSVNNGIYLVESTKEYIVIHIREKLVSILVTSLSTMVGSLPLLLSDSGSFSAALAFFMVWGTAGSLVVSLLVFPAVIDHFYRRTT